MAKFKKPFYKKWWVWLIALVIIGSIAVGGGEDSSQPVNTSNGASEESDESKDTSKDKDSAKLSEEEFGKIKDGMTYEEVVEIIGSEGEVLSETGEKGTDLHTVMYTWEGEGSLGANANLTFQGGELVNKSQFGVGEGSDVKVTKEQFDKIENGMTYDEVVNIIGGEGNLLSESGEKGTDMHTVMYEYSGEGDLGANASFMFQGGELVNKSQMGLK